MKNNLYKLLIYLDLNLLANFISTMNKENKKDAITINKVIELKIYTFKTSGS